MDDLLRAYIREALQLELRLDPHMMALLRGSDIRHGTDPSSVDARRVAEEWLEDGVSPRDRAIVTRFVAKRWAMILARYRGDVRAAKQTMYNILDTRFHNLRVYDQ
jgi:hypothetical protein